MACFYPLEAWQVGTGPLVFKRPDGGYRRALKVPCGQCTGCRLERSRQWASRIMHEAQLHEWNSFITLTYNEDNVPRELVHRHFQLFMKRLRKKFRKARFFMCGEYGEQYGRPHYHACIFGVHFSDRVVYKELSSGHRLYTSSILTGLWPHGFASVGDVSFESAAYVARYVMKKVTGDMAEEAYQRFDGSTGEIFQIEPEYCRMSLKPGIGAEWYRRFKADVYPRDQLIVNGVACRPPKYYDILLERESPTILESLKLARVENAKKFSADNVPARLAVREKVARARLNFKVRTLE